MASNDSVRQVEGELAVSLVSSGATTQLEEGRHADTSIRAVLSHGSVGDAEYEDHGVRCRCCAKGFVVPPRIRLVAFLSLHLIMVIAQLFAMVFFGHLGNWGMFTLMFLPFTASGVLCGLAAWRSRTPYLKEKLGMSIGLPLCRYGRIGGTLLAIPFGLLQLVIVAMEIEDFLEWRRSSRSVEQVPDAPGMESLRGDCPGAGNERISAGREKWVDKFHCKAINGALEGLFASTVVYFGYFGLGFPEQNPILPTPTGLKGGMYKHILRVILIIAAASTGLCLLEIDFAVSKRVKANYLKGGLRYELFHCLFRVSEVSSRITLFVLFTVLTFRHTHWWWVPLATDLALCLFLTDMYGGCERTNIVRLICMVPCAFANVFFFVDSPSKHRASRKLTKAFTCKNLLEMIGLPVLCYFWNRDSQSNIISLFKKDPFSVILAIATHPLYWIVFWCMYKRQTADEEEKDIFTASQEGEKDRVQNLTQTGGDALDIDNYDIDGKTPLMLAVRRCSNDLPDLRQADYAAICKYLIEAGARIDRPVYDDGRFFWALVRRSQRLRWTALHMAAAGGCATIVTALVLAHRSVGGSVKNTKDANGDTPLHIAVRNKHEEIAKLLAREWKGWVKAKNRARKTPLDIATPSINTMIMEELSAHQDLDDQIAQPEQQSWVRLGITRTFVDRPCHAPGLSSFLASSGGGTLGKVFLAPVPEDETYEEENVSFPDEGSAIEPLPPVSLQEIEPVDKYGAVCQVWQAATRQSGPALDVENFAFIGSKCVLGEGSYGKVWRARKKETGELFAVKNMKGETRVFQREVQMSKSVRLKPHPCVVGLHSVYDFPDTGWLLLVMEYCTGGDMQGRLKRLREESRQAGKSYSPPDNAWQWIGQVFLALEHLHLQMNILYRDLKPANVVLCEGGIAKLTDFGFGRQGTQSAGTWSFAIPTGSPGYTAPEVFQQKPTNETCDLYSFGVLMWVVLTGGVTTDKTPRPPVSVQQGTSTSYSVFVKDCLKLKNCIEYPDKYNALPLPLSATDLVKKLIDKSPKSRPKHPYIRQNLQSILDLRLPSGGCSKTEIEDWLNHSFAVNP